jgi:hypothetical protein
VFFSVMAEDLVQATPGALTQAGAGALTQVVVGGLTQTRGRPRWSLLCRPPGTQLL